jgi:ABC-type uncharacterized transport system involved in gliding motility auxiliary subunit
MEEVGVFNLDEEKENLTGKLSEHYSQNIITMEEYERILEYINKIETKKEITIIRKIIQENNVKDNELVTIRNNEMILPQWNGEHLGKFLWGTAYKIIKWKWQVICQFVWNKVK